MADLNTNSVADRVYMRAQLDVVSSLGERMRRALRRAQQSNPMMLPPLTLPPLWQATTAYSSDTTVRTSTGNIYNLAIAGTSGSSEPTGTTSSTVADGTASWIFAGTVEGMAADDPSAPTFSVSAVDANPYGQTITPSTTNYSDYVSLKGCYPVTATGGVKLVRYQSKDDGTLAEGYCAVEFESDTSNFALRILSDVPVNLVIDGRYYSLGQCIHRAGGAKWLKWSFGNSRKNRSFRLEFKSFSTLLAMGIDAGAQMWPTANPDTIRAWFTGDSYLAGSSYGPNQVGRHLANVFGMYMGWDDVWSIALGGRGYKAVATAGDRTFGGSIAEGLTRNPDVWPFLGSVNDNGQLSSDITASALSTFQAIRTGGSTAPIIVAGVPSINNANVAANEAALQAAITAFADPIGQTYFIPFYGATPSAWLNSSNYSRYMGGDAVHLVDVGTQYTARRMAREVAARVIPNIK